jgi:hypothetical protein
MKTITVPSDVVLCNPVTRKPLEPEVKKSFRDYAFEAWLNDQRIAPTRADFYRLIKIQQTFDLAVAGVELSIEDADYDRVRPIVQERGPLYSPGIETQLLCFDEAFLNAAPAPVAVEAPPQEASK